MDDVDDVDDFVSSSNHPIEGHLQLAIHLGQHLLTMPSPRVFIAAVDVPGVLTGFDRLTGPAKEAKKGAMG